MEQEQFKCDHARERKQKQRDTASEESKASATMTPPQHVSLRLETRMTLGSLPETLQTTALPSSPLYLIPSTYTWLQRISTCIFPDILREAYSVHAYS